MFSAISRGMFSRAAGLARMNQARGMAHINSENPKLSGNIMLIGGLTMFLVTATIVQTNGLITWGRAPNLAAALKKD